MITLVTKGLRGKRRKNKVMSLEESDEDNAYSKILTTRFFLLDHKHLQKYNAFIIIIS